MDALVYSITVGIIVGAVYLLHAMDKHSALVRQKLDFDTTTDAWASLVGLKRLQGESSEDLRKRISNKLKGE